MEPILEVRNLSVGFRTAGGVVQAVRDISFVLPRGRTLAVVGESGSGKSVTCRAILGILAGNAVVQSGEILFDGQDLLKLSEDDFYPIRGDKIAMIFQDPMSSLNPIMRVGKQLTEAMLLKNKSARRGARAAFRGKLHLLNDALVQALQGKQTAAQIGKTVRAYARSFRADTLPQDGEAVPHRQAFADWARAGVQLSHDTATERKRALLPLLYEYAAKISADMQETELRALCRRLRELARAAIDELSVQKNSAEYTFGTSFSAAVKRFTDGKKNNPKAQARYDRKMQAYRKAESRGRTPAALPAPPAICDLSRAAQAIGQVLLRLAAVYEEKLGDADSFDAQAQALRLFDYLRGQAAVAAASISERLARERAVRLLQEVGLPSPESMMQKYPFELSGGMRQRVVIAIALAADPDILICDEPTTALDVTIQAQILELINRIKAERNLTVLFITHDLGVVANMADEIAVMYAGKIVEYGSAEEVFYDPRHPYTWALLSSMPDLDTKEKLEAIPGTPPNMLYPPKGDAFAARNQYALAIDFERQPPMFAVTPTHRAATWLLHPDAPTLQPPETVLRRIERMRTRTVGVGTAAQRQGKETRAKTSAARRRKS